jgi:hypothetical protein
MAAIRYCYDRLSFFLSLLPIFKGKTNNNSSRTVVLSIARSSLLALLCVAGKHFQKTKHPTTHRPTKTSSSSPQQQQYL